MIGVFICSCAGENSKIGEFIREKTGAFVEAGDRLCEKPGMLRRLVDRHKLKKAAIACSAECESLFAEALGRAGIAPFLIEVVNSASTKKAKLELLAAVRKLEKLDVSMETLKVSIDSKGTRYGVVAHVKQDRCSRCRLCLERCPYSAIFEETIIKVNRTKCNSCGICTTACPTGAMQLPNYTPWVVDAAMQALLSREVSLEPRILVLACKMLPLGITLPNVVEMSLPCMGMLSTFLILRAFDLGADGVVVASCASGECPHRLSVKEIQGTVNLAGEILNAFGIDRMIRLILPTPSMEKEIIEFESRAASAKSPLKSKVPASVREHKLSELLSDFRKKLGPKQLIIKDEELGFGITSVDKEKCTACGVCVSHCPSGALKFAGDSKAVKLIFSYSECIACGRCVKVCPEKALLVDKTFDLARLIRQQDVTLVQNGVICCEKCKKPFISKSMLQKISGLIPLETMKLCPECRSKINIKFNFN